MKRFIQILIIASLGMVSNQVVAQSAISISIHSGNFPTYTNSNRFEYKELQRFQNQIERFNYAIDDERVFEARRIKSNLVKKMRSEIRDTQKKIREYRMYKGAGGLKQKYDVSYQYRKQRGSNKVFHRDIKELERLQKKQRKLLFKFENLYLERSHSFYKQARKHQKLLFEFEDTMWKALEFDSHRNKRRRR
ncbi:hypothetical protein [Balneola vulgaris]|uniref:hypothetical protein n=1 Tax=Balneola vulgaris TaxID=287535 RepID=UPI00037A4BE8|nr:hypothetical protein [Balneola vulgaris]